MAKAEKPAEKPADDALRSWTERDLTAAARAGELPAAHEAEELLAQAHEVISSGRHLVFSGESGVGKTALVQELVRRSLDGSGPEPLAGKRVLQISLRQRAARLKSPDQLRPQFQELVDALVENADTVVPFFSDFDLAQSFQVVPLLSLLALRFRGPILGEGNRAALLDLFESWTDLESRYIRLDVEEPDLARTSRLLAAWAKEPPRGDRRFLPEALDEALHLSHRFLSRSRLPRKAVDLLTNVASVTPAGTTVSADEVVERFAVLHRVPRVLVDPKVPLDLSAVEARFSAEVLGQAEAVRAIVRMVGLIKSGLTDARRAFGVFLFVGPTGVGKTHAAQLLAEYLFGSRDRLVRLNMADFQFEGAPEAIFGDPSDGRPLQRRGLLTQRLSGHSFAVLLLDELEKAHDKVQDKLLQLFDEGCFINGHGETVSCRSTILIATSNAGAEVYRERPLGFFAPADAAALSKELERRIAQRFRVEFLNRFDQVVHFRPLTRADVRTIAERELQGLKQRTGVKRSGASVEVDEAVVDWLAVHGYDPHFGARFLRRTLEREVTAPLAAVLAETRAGTGPTIRLAVARGRVEARLVSLEEEGRARHAVVTLPRGTETAERTLGRSGLLAEAAALRKAAETRLAGLAKNRDEAARLLAKMNETGFWSAPAESAETLAAYRDLDVTIQSEERLASPLRALAETPEDADLPLLARRVEAAAAALAEWTERLADEGARAAWLLVERVDPTQPSGAFLADVVEMERAWCGRLGVEAVVVAYEAPGEAPERAELVRAVLEVEGPGIGTYLSMEEGIHRLFRRGGGDPRVRVELVPRPAEACDAALAERASRSVRPARRRRGLFDLALAARGRFEIEESGFVLDLVGTRAETLAAFFADLARRRADAGTPARDVARHYGQDGTGARDPRTGASVPRLKDVLRGRLDPLLEAWRRR